MATGRSNWTVKQTGEALAIAELGRRGWIAASFSGNVPDFDIIASNENYMTIHIQVKTSNGQSWHINANKHLDIHKDNEKQIQIVKGKKSLPKSNVFHFFIMLNDTGKDDFFIVPQSDLQHIVFKEYNDYINRTHGKRVENWESTHFAMKPSWIKQFKDMWDILNKDSISDAPSACGY